MDLQIALLLAQDGLTNGAIYALLALALVLVFAVTRVIFIPQGEFIAYGALSLASLQLGSIPGTLWLLLGAGCLVTLIEAPRRREGADWRRFALRALWLIGGPTALLGMLWSIDTAGLPLAIQVLLVLAIVVPLGPHLYRLAYQPLATAPVLVLLIVSVAVHFVLTGLGLLFFGAEGSRTPAFTDLRIDLAGAVVNGQTLLVIVASAVLIAVLYSFFERTIYGKALRAVAVNRTGARLMGISTELAGRLSFTVAALIGALSGILIGPITTIYYDTGFLMGLKGFVGAIIGGLASYPLAAGGALIVGLLEAYASFWASAYKEVIVFMMIIPVLLWRSLRTHHIEEDE